MIATHKKVCLRGLTLNETEYQTGGGEFTLIDTRPAIDHKSVTKAIAQADRIVMPCTPSPGDITAARATVEVVRRSHEKKEPRHRSCSTW